MGRNDDIRVTTLHYLALSEMKMVTSLANIHEVRSRHSWWWRSKTSDSMEVPPLSLLTLAILDQPVERKWRTCDAVWYPKTWTVIHAILTLAFLQPNVWETRTIYKAEIWSTSQVSRKLHFGPFTLAENTVKNNALMMSGRKFRMKLLK